jgi:hypothetical protein
MARQPTWKPTDATIRGDLLRCSPSAPAHSLSQHNCSALTPAVMHSFTSALRGITSFSLGQYGLWGTDIMPDADLAAFLQNMPLLTHLELRYTTVSVLLGL